MSLMSRILMILVLATYAATGMAAEESATTPMPAKTNGEKWWRGNFDRILSDIKKMEGQIDLAFIGDSITARWGSGDSFKKHWGAYRAVNMGIGGDRTQNVLWRNENGQLDGYKARVFVVLIGTNNCWGKSTDPADVAAGVKAILAQIQTKQPQAKILLLSILPCGEKPNPGRETRNAVNDLISKFAGGAVHYMDISGKFLEPDKSISKEVMHDSLHLAPKGFDIWAEAIGDKVKELMGDAKSEKSP
jgi:lysophospholipase L1-like esterase